MHKEIQSEKPGRCPKCGMKLVEKEMTKTFGKTYEAYSKKTPAFIPKFTFLLKYARKEVRT
ncbi:MAG: hypothetical protein M1444_02960 [Patescibacteria group bacterium]|nr:hypothetical protein [Patescibacteria group bacterium]